MSESNRSPYSLLSMVGPVNSAIWLAAIVGMSLSFAALVMIGQQLEAHKTLDFEWVAHNRVRALNHALDTSVRAVTTLRDHVIASGNLKDDSFRMFAASILGSELGAHALLWVPQIKASERKAYEASRAGSDGGFQITQRNSHFNVTAAGARAEYFPAHHVVAVPGDTIPKGFDLGSVPELKETLILAREQGRMVTSQRIAYPTPQGGAEYGFMVANPIFERDDATTPADTLRPHLTGFVVGFFRLAAVTKNTISLLEPRGVEILILDHSAPVEERFLHFYASRLSPRSVGADSYEDWWENSSEPRFVRNIRVADRKLLVICGRTSLFRSAEAFQDGPWLAMLVGLAFTIFLSFYLARVNEHSRQRAAMQRQLAEREELFRQMTETVDEAFWAATPDGRDLLYLAPAYNNILGLPGGRERMSLLSAAYPEDRHAVSDALQKTGRDGVDCEAIYRIHHADGSFRWVRIRAFAVRDPRDRIYRLVGYVQDITERKLADEALRESEATLKNLFRNSPDVIMTVDARGKILLMNRSIPALPAERAVGHSSLALMPRNFRKRFRKVLARVFNKGDVRKFEHSAADGTIWEGRIVPIYGGPEQVTAAMVIAADVTEKRQLENQALHNARLASIGVLAAGVAHEINNPNNAIQFNASLVSRAWNDITPILQSYFKENGDFALSGMSFSEAHAKFPRLLSEIIRNSDRIRHIVQNLKHMSRQDTGDLSARVNIQEVLESVVGILHNQIQKRTDLLSLEVPDDLPPVRGNAQQLEQVFLNVLMNALFALRERSKGVYIRAGFDIDQRVVWVTVRDEGQGIPKRDLARLTEPFFTTHGDSGGTGLGLSISRSIVQRHGGSMSFQSALDEGTVVTVRTPAIQKQ